MANQRDFEKSRKVRETSIVDRISFLLFYNVWEEAPAQTPRRAVWEGPSPSPGHRQGEQRLRSRCLTFSKGQYLYILMGLVQMKTSVLGRERSGEAVCPQTPAWVRTCPHPSATALATTWDTSPGPANHTAAPVQPATQRFGATTQT